MRRFFFLISILLICSRATAQQDTLPSPKSLLDEIVITASRTETKLGNVAVPVQIVSKKYIKQTGSLRLQDILQEQTGIIIVNSNLTSSLSGYPNPFGQGVQMLGLDPAYTSILIDGEPLVGRNAGILKLGRIATGNIKQIEIVKGPSSSLYGSEAMAGVVNVITENPTNEILSLQLHAASNKTHSQSFSYTKQIKKTGLQIFSNRYYTGGYDLNKSIYGKTIDPYRDINANIKITSEITNNIRLLLSFRNFDSKQENDYQITWQQAPAVVKGFTKEKDNTFFGQLTYTINNSNKVFFRTFYNKYSNRAFTDLENTGIRFDETTFNQSILKPEIQYEYSNKINRFIIGGGAYFEEIDASRYAGKQKLANNYIFTQNELKLLHNTLTVIAGIRADKRTDFNLTLNPRIAISYQPSDKWKFNASWGKGFKAPDFRHMYLNLYNAQIGYTLIGGNVLAQQLTILSQNGELESGSNIAPYLNNLFLQPEKSTGFHVGGTFTNNKLKTEYSIFYNDIRNLIDVYLLPIQKTNSRSIYSYHNVKNIFTRGMEMNLNYKINNTFIVSAGYQYLEAKDKEILNQIKSGNIYSRDPETFTTKKVTLSDYFGLPNRSRHNFNLKLSWEEKTSDINAFVRIIYRGKYGFGDTNGNAIIDNQNEMVNGFWLANAACGKKIHRHFDLQIGVENIFNYINPLQLPNLSGRIFFLNLNYSINYSTKKNKKQHD